jgi:hypothetical protein
MKRKYLAAIVVVILFAGLAEMFVPSNTVQGIVLDDTFYTGQSISNNFRYRYLVKSSLSGDENSFAELINFWCGGGAGCYDHGHVLIQILIKIGDEKFSIMIKKLNNVDKSYLISLLQAGQEYGLKKDVHFLKINYPNTMIILQNPNKSDF